MSTVYDYMIEEPITAPTPIVRVAPAQPMTAERDTDEVVRQIAASVWSGTKAGYGFTSNTAAGARIVIGQGLSRWVDIDGRRDVQDLNEQMDALKERGRELRKAKQRALHAENLAAWKQLRDDRNEARSRHNKAFHRRFWSGLAGVPSGMVVTAALAEWQWAQMPWTLQALVGGAAVAGSVVGARELHRIGRDRDRSEPVHTRFRRKPKVDDAFIAAAFKGLNFGALKTEDVIPAGPLVPLNKKGTSWQRAYDLPGDMVIQDIISRHAQLEKLLGAPVGGLRISGDPTKGAGRIILRVSDKHSSQREIGASPLAGISEFSIDSPVVLGEDTFGNPFPVSVANSHVFLGGMTQMGKTLTIEALLAWLLLDRSVDYHEIDLSPIDRDAPEDTSSYRRLRALTSYSVVGSDKKALDEALEYMRWLDNERGKRSRNSRHLVLVIDEFHELFMSTAHKMEAERLLNRIGRNSLKYNIHIIAATQRPDANSIPTSVLEQFGIRVGFFVMQSHTSDLIIPNGQQRKVDCSKLPKQPGYCIIDHAGEATQVRIYPPDNVLIEAKALEALAMRGGVVEKLDISAADRELPGALTALLRPSEAELDPRLKLLLDIIEVATPAAEQIAADPLSEFVVQTDPLVEMLRKHSGEYKGLTSSDLRKRMEGFGLRSHQKNYDDGKTKGSRRGWWFSEIHNIINKKETTNA